MPRRFKCSLVLGLFKFSSKLLNNLAGWLKIGVARIAVKLKRASAERALKLFARECDRLVVIVRAEDVELNLLAHFVDLQA